MGTPHRMGTPAIRITPEEILREYNVNPVEADLKYNGKRVLLPGIIVEADSRGELEG